MSAHKDHPSALCKICKLSDRIRAEMLLAGGAAQRAVARKFGVTHHSLGRHWRLHVTPERKAALQFGPLQREALASQVMEESASVLDHYRAVRSALYLMFDAAVTAGDRNGAALLSGKLHENFGAMARITGELASSPLVSITNTQQTNNVLIADPAFAGFQALLIAALRPFPDARDAVLAEFRRFEAPSAEIDAPQLTHQGETIDAEQ